VSQVLKFEFAVLPCAVVIGISAILNLIVSAAFPLDRRVSDKEAALQLGFDLLQLAILIWLTGGMSNPFALLLLAPVVTSATTLSRPVLFSLGALATALSFALLYNSQPLPWSPPGSFTLPYTFRFGVWIAIIVGTVFTSLYAWRVTLAATEAVLAQEQKLSALGGLAAAAAHELGTPLATIQITAKEMTREIPTDTPLGEDAQLVLSQAQRCRDILQQLSMRGDAGDLIHAQMRVEDLLEEAAEPYITLGKDISISIDGDGEEPILNRQAELLYGLKNFVENAVDFATQNVSLSGHWDGKSLTLTIDDDGEGFQTGIPGGLGLGVFISTTLIERTGGQVNFGQSPLGGAQVRLTWPLTALQAL